MLLVLLTGLGTGFVTQLLQSVLPTGWSQAANAISPWLLVAFFFIGAALPDRGSAVVAGLATLVLALVGYYATTQLRYGIGGGTSALIFWGLGAAVGGPVFGLAGHTWRTGEHRYRARSDCSLPRSSPKAAMTCSCCPSRAWPSGSRSPAC